MFLSKVEQAYLADKEQFSKTKQRYIRYRINKKLKMLDRDAAAAFSRDAAVRAVAGSSLVERYLGKVSVKLNDRRYPPPQTGRGHGFESRPRLLFSLFFFYL